MSQVVGYRYLFGIHMGISRGPVDELIEIKVGDRTAWRGSVRGVAPPGFVGPFVPTPSTFRIDQPELFGGERMEGGIIGDFTVMMGGPTQTAPTALATVLQQPMPGFRRMFTAFFDGVISMMNPYPKPWKFRVRRALGGWDGDPWYPEKAVISLTRPVSAAETAASQETQSITNSEDITNFVLNTGTNKYDCTLGGNLSGTVTTTAIVTVTVQGYFTINPDFIESYQVDVSRYTRVGNVVSVDADFSWINGVFTFVPTTFSVVYQATVGTDNPLLGIGDALIQAMNPAHIIYECYTNREWGRGLPRSELDDTAWRYAADLLFGERFGLCIRWNRTDSIQAFVQGILDHIGAVIYPDRTTGKIVIKLIRDDYNIDSLPLYDADSGLKSVTEGSVSANGKMINEVRVTYRDPVTNEDRTVRASNIAGIQAAGGIVNSMSREYKGLPTAEIASRVAKRELRAMSPSVRRFNLVFDRRGFDLVPGSVVRIRDPGRNIKPTVVRIGTIDYGTEGAGDIKVVALQDAFGLPKSGIQGAGSVLPPGNNPVGGVVQPCIGLHRVIEVPYRSMYRALSAADFAFVDPNGAFLGAVVGEGQPLNTNYNLAVKSGAPDPSENPPDGSYNCPI